jgi:hypothetical protein
MKRILFILLLVPLFLTADAKKYTFEVTITAKDKTLKEATEMFQEFEKLASKYKVTIDMKLMENKDNRIEFTPGIYLTPLIEKDTK